METPADAFRRVAHHIAKAETEYGSSPEQVQEIEEQFFEMLDRQDFMPNSPTFTGAGTELGQLSACFVLPVGDSLSDIFETMKQSALIHQTGGGTGFAFSRLRPTGDSVRSSQGVASGPVSFMKVYNAATEAIKQGGTRRGANMGILRVDHPDILQFMHCKDDITQINNFNISIAITDEFMEALKNEAEYNLYNPRDGQVFGAMKASDVWNQLVEGAWMTGEPGMVFIDRINRRNPNNHAEDIEATNPCGEQPLPPFGSCNLGSINLANFVENPYTTEAEVDWGRLWSLARLTTRFLDNVIDMNKYPVEGLALKARNDRRIGLGVMGWAEMLVQLGLPYDSQEAVEMAGEVMSYVKDASLHESQRLALDRGPYPEWEGSQWDKAGFKVRNATLTTVAPTGTISMFAAQSQHPAHVLFAKHDRETRDFDMTTLGMPCSGGIEPKFALVFTRNQAEMKMLDIDQQFEFIARSEGWYSDQLMAQVAATGSCRGVEGVPDRWQRVFGVSNEIDFEWHVRMQSAFQGGDETEVDTQPLDAACSKTINFPNTATRDDVNRAYLLAWELGLKGITVYRDGSRYGQVLSIGNVQKDEPAVAEQDPSAPTIVPSSECLGPDDHDARECQSGGTLKHEGGCVSCTCGWSACHIS